MARWRVSRAAEIQMAPTALTIMVCCCIFLLDHRLNQVSSKSSGIFKNERKILFLLQGVNMFHGCRNKRVSKASILHRGSRVRFRNSCGKVLRWPASLNNHAKFRFRMSLELRYAINVSQFVHLDIEQHWRAVAVLAFTGSIFNSIHELNHCFDGFAIVLCKINWIFLGFLINITVRTLLLVGPEEEKNPPSNCRWTSGRTPSTVRKSLVCGLYIPGFHNAWSGPRTWKIYSTCNLVLRQYVIADQHGDIHYKPYDTSE